MNTTALFEAADFNPLMESWTSAGRAISEAKLSPEQITALFGAIEQGARASGTNRTAIGKGADAVGAAAGAVNNAYQGIISKIGNLGPVKGFDNAFDSMASKLKDATGGDEGIAKYVYAYRAFAKNHPILQNLIYSALIAGVGLATGGVAPIAVLGLFKATDRLLQGDRLSAALIKGGVTAGAAGLFRELQSYLKGAAQPTASQQQGMMGRGLPNDTSRAIPNYDQQQGMLGRGLPPRGPTLPQGANPGDVATGGYGAPSVGGFNYSIQPGDTLSDLAKRFKVSVNDILKANPGYDPTSIRDNPDLIQKFRSIKIPPVTGNKIYDLGVGTAADTARRKALAQDKWSDGYETTGSSNLSEYIDREATIQSWFLSEGVLDDGSRSVWVYETAVPVIFQQIEEAGFFQGLKDIGSSIGKGIGSAASAVGKGIGSAASAVGNYVGTAARNIANKTTADKLNTAWQKSTYSQGGGSVDSKTVVQFLRQMGVEDAIIKSTFKSMKIPFPRGPRKPKAAAPQAATAAKPKVRVPAGSKPSTPFKGFGGALQSAAESVSDEDIMNMISEAKNLAQQAAIAINMKKRGKKPKGKK